jgi:hypothetical protein
VAEVDLDHPDVLLGRIADQGVDVRRRVGTHIDVASSRPNAMHEAIVPLAASGPVVRHDEL